MSTLIVDTTPSLLHPDLLDAPGSRALYPTDIPIPPDEISPLVDQVHAGFRCADLLLRLPGAIPIPSFTIHPSLPSPDWVDTYTHSFTPEVVNHLLKDPYSCPLHPSIPFSLVSPDRAKIPAPPRSILQSPLLVRPPNPSVYTPEGRSTFLSSIGVPKSTHDPDKTRILIVSFGGQIFHTPRSRSSSPAPDAPGTPNHSHNRSGRHKQATPGSPSTTVFTDFTNSVSRRNTTAHPKLHRALVTRRRSNSQRIATDQHLWLPGAPSAARKFEVASPTTLYAPGFEAVGSPLLPSLPTVIATPSTPLPTAPLEDIQNVAGYVSRPHPHPPSGFVDTFYSVTELVEVPKLLPEGWIAVVCGASKEQGEDSEHLPEGFYIAPKDVYMPDLTAVADVLLGKLVRPSVTFAYPVTHDRTIGVRKRLGSPRLSDSLRLRLPTIVH